MRIRLDGGTPSGRPIAVRKRATYFIGAFTKGGRLKAIKLGLCTVGKHERRLKALSTGNPDTLRILLVVEGNFEKKWMRTFSGFRINKEWFRPALPILRLIENLRKVQGLVQTIEAREATASSLVPQSESPASQSPIRRRDSAGPLWSLWATDESNRKDS